MLGCEVGTGLWVEDDFLRERNRLSDIKGLCRFSGIGVIRYKYPDNEVGTKVG